MKAATLNNKFQIFPFLISLFITFCIGGVASVVTRPQIASWYITLTKPTYNPPNWAFPIAWSILYFLIGTAAYMVWKRRNNSTTYATARIIYFVQLLLNFSWSIVFFGMHQIFAALCIIIMLLVVIILNIAWFGRFSKPAAWLLVPYILWVGFASLLNLSIYILNK
ncbi:tryptophan-rich sensory protein [Inquilinus sp. KBS0705]|nr:tryptophan-rich sensory protein [Inquilinus sp. KBS0705]